LAAPILILGAPRSGTTWLAKIIDSHPEVLYRHEPDAAAPPPCDLTPDLVPALLTRWAADRSPHSVTKQPYFRKSWQSGGARLARTMLAGAVSMAARLPWPFQGLGRMELPDLAARPARRLAIKSVGWIEGAAVVARALPDSRTVFMLRHPCGQVASVMRGTRQGRFDLRTEGTDMPFDEQATIRFAATHGLQASDFQALPDAAKYAWNWRALNEPAYAALAAQPNVHVVLYEALCADPQQVVRQILRFAGLDWTAQTADFVARSTTGAGQAGYHAIVRDTASAAEAWRGRMAPADQASVRAVAAASGLARFWPDLLAGSQPG
jgi:hypothetical protein